MNGYYAADIFRGDFEILLDDRGVLFTTPYHVTGLIIMTLIMNDFLLPRLMEYRSNVNELRARRPPPPPSQIRCIANVVLLILSSYISGGER